MRSILLFTVVAVLGVADIGRCGEMVVVERETRSTIKLFGPAANQDKTELVYYGDRRVRIDEKGFATYRIFDLRDGGFVLYEIDAKRREYVRLDLGGSADDQKEAFVRSAFGSAAMMGRMAALPQGEVKLKHSGVTSKIAGRSAKLAVFEQGPREVLRVWYTEAVKAPGPSALDLMRGSTPLSPKLFEKRAELGGFELAWRLDMGSVQIETKTVKIETRGSPKGHFDVPEGFKEKLADPSKAGDGGDDAAGDSSQTPVGDKQ